MSDRNDNEWFWLHLDALIAQNRSARNRLPPFPEPLAGSPDAMDHGYQTWTPEEQYWEFEASR